MNARLGPIRWSEGAKTALTALRGAADPNGVIYTYPALRQILFGTPPDSSLLSRALRDPAVWPGLTSFLDGHLKGPGLGAGWPGWNLEIRAEELARSKGARNVGERHLAELLLADGSSWLIDSAKGVALISEWELGGPLQMAPDDHTEFVVDTSIFIQGGALNTVNWCTTLQASPPIRFWILRSVIDEVDALVLHKNARVRGKARAARRWIGEQLAAARSAEGAYVADGVRARIWEGQVSAGNEDPDHLDGALALAERGLVICVVTYDVGLVLACDLLGLPATRLDSAPDSPDD
ncbi:MAG: PIN domain-containing protein [Candidatus Dormibacteria bacterium]